MLKLEKTSSSSGFTISMRKKEQFFEPRLIKALCIALFFHISAIALFHITPFYTPSSFIFTPIQVNSDRTFIAVRSHVTSHVDEEEISFPSISFIPPLASIPFSKELSLFSSSYFDPHTLDLLENSIKPKWESPLCLPLEEPRIQLIISGDLASFSISKSTPILNQMQPISFHTNRIYMTYQVQLDQETGELFWWDRGDSTENMHAQSVLESILHELRFAKTAEQIDLELAPLYENIRGEITFVIFPEKSEQK